MPRTDLISLSDEDLVALSNRGLLKSARKDLDDGVTGSLTESDAGELRVAWSDGKVCDLAAGAALRQGRCSCGAVGVCRHLLRLPLWLRSQQAHVREAGSLAAENWRAEPWDPGAFGDGELRDVLGAATLARAERLAKAGVLAELLRGEKPAARFHVPVATVRFLVKDDLRYARCDCARERCEHVALAVSAFRELPAGESAGLVTMGDPACAAPPEVFTHAEAFATDLVARGVSGADAGRAARVAKLEAELRAAGLFWPAEVVAELAAAQRAYESADARFDPETVADLLGELLIRCDALRHGASLPAALIAGSESDVPVELDGVREFRGLGCEVRATRREVRLEAVMLDTKSMGVVVAGKSVDESRKDADRAPSFAELSTRIAIPGKGGRPGPSFDDLGRGVFQLRGGRRSASGRLMAGRAESAVLEQTDLAWEDIPPPLLVREAAELQRRLSSLPPSALRPRRVADDFYVFAVAGVEEAGFDPATQSVRATLADGAGGTVLLEHPYLSRGASGAEALMRRLTRLGANLLFVSGRVTRRGGGLVIRPVGTVWREGERRVLVQPWLEAGSAAAQSSASAPTAEKADAVAEYVGETRAALGEMVLAGLQRADVGTAGRWRELASAGEGLGLARLPAKLRRVAEALEARGRDLRWEAESAAGAVLEVAALVRLGRDA